MNNKEYEKEQDFWSWVHIAWIICSVILFLILGILNLLDVPRVW